MHQYARWILCRGLVSRREHLLALHLGVVHLSVHSCAAPEYGALFEPEPPHVIGAGAELLLTIDRRMRHPPRDDVAHCLRMRSVRGPKASLFAPIDGLKDIS